MSETLKAVQDMTDEAPVTDVTETFVQWQDLLNELKAKIAARFELNPDPSTGELESFGADDGPRGSLAGFSGPEVDWMIHSWVGDPEHGFVNLHLTVWLGPQVRVPHLGLALLCWPGGWFYLDSVPRTSLVADGDYYDRYYAPAEEECSRCARSTRTFRGSPAAAASSGAASPPPRTATRCPATSGTSSWCGA